MEPLTLLFDEVTGEPLPLPPALLSLYGPLRMPTHPDRAHVFANFVASVDGIVAIDPPRGSGADISEGDDHDRALMGVLRAVADAVVIGGGNLRASSDHVWTAERVCPELAGAFKALRAALGKTQPPLQIVVSGSGSIDPSWPVFGPEAPALIVTTPVGAARLGGMHRHVRIATVPSESGWIPARQALEAAGLGPGARVLLETGPTSMARFVADKAVDELFLTVAPVLVGHTSQPPTLSLLEGRLLFPGAHRTRLLSARRRANFLYLRYAIG